MSSKLFCPVLTVLLLVLSACGTLEVGIELTPTIPVVTPPTVTQEPSPVATLTAVTPLTGTVSGRVCYPSETIPAMQAYFQDTASGEVTQIEIAENQTDYQVELLPGTYVAFAWWQPARLGGIYTAAVACGLNENCNDHSALPFEVTAGGQVFGIDICDWPFDAASMPIPLEGSEPGSYLAGLIYRGPGGLWKVTANGEPALLNDRAVTAITPDGRFALLDEGLREISLLDQSTGAEFNLAEISERHTCCGVLWPARSPGSVLFSSWPLGTEIGLGSEFMTGLLTLYEPDTGVARVLDDEHDVLGTIAPSPDGRTIAYGGGANPLLYDLETGEITTFEPSSYGLDSSMGVTLISPAWSPDGRRLAWHAQGGLGPNRSYGLGIAVFDLEGRTVEILHPYNPLGTDALPGAASWSPDGRWLVFTAIDQELTQNGLWLVRADGVQSEEYYLGQGFNPVWSPDSGRLAFWGTAPGEPERSPAMMLAQASEWRVEALDTLHDSARPVAWPPP